MSKTISLLSFAVVLLSLSHCSSACAEDKTDSEKAATREERLAKYLSGTQFVGKFTIDGKDADPKTEAYTIKSCEKLPSADLYRFKARIKYGKVDQEVPMDLKILWSGDTPVITLDSLWIPGMGTFDARVMIDAGRYAGTWQHGQAGGHMFGKIVPLSAADSDDEGAKDNATDNATDSAEKALGTTPAP